MKWLDKLLGRKNIEPENIAPKNIEPAPETPQTKEEARSPQTVFSEAPPLPWDAPAWEKIRSSDYVRWYLTQVGAIERYTETYQVTFIPMWNSRNKTVELPGSCSYDDVLSKLETVGWTQTDHWYRILNWPHVQPVWGTNATNQHCWLCEFEKTDLVFRVMDIVESPPTDPPSPPVLYGCPFASDIPIPDRSQRPVSVIRFGDGS